MPTTIDERDIQTSLSEPGAWPNLSQAARITGLSKSTLSKQAHAGRIRSEVRGLGRGNRILPLDEVLRISYRYQRIPQATLVERFAGFLSRKLSIDGDLVQRALWARLEEATSSSHHSPGAQPISSLERGVETPGWLLEVESLRSNPGALEGTLSFVSADELTGTITLGASIDDPVETDPAAWKAAW